MSHIVNPLTGRLIQYGGKTHMALIGGGHYKDVVLNTLDNIISTKKQYLVTKENLEKAKSLKEIHGTLRDAISQLAEKLNDLFKKLEDLCAQLESHLHADGITKEDSVGLGIIYDEDEEEEDTIDFISTKFMEVKRRYLLKTL